MSTLSLLSLEANGYVDSDFLSRAQKRYRICAEAFRSRICSYWCSIYVGYSGLSCSLLCRNVCSIVVTENLESLGDSITTAVVVSWNKEPGDSVKEDDVIAVVETDKVTMDIRAKQSGVFVEALVPSGEVNTWYLFFLLLWVCDRFQSVALSTKSTLLPKLHRFILTQLFRPLRNPKKRRALPPLKPVPNLPRKISS